MKKLKRKTVVKYDNGDRYTFINGMAVVPGVLFKGKAFKISLKTFNEWVKKCT